MCVGHSRYHTNPKEQEQEHERANIVRRGTTKIAACTHSSKAFRKSNGTSSPIQAIVRTSRFQRNTAKSLPISCAALDLGRGNSGWSCDVRGRPLNDSFTLVHSRMRNGLIVRIRARTRDYSCQSDKKKGKGKHLWNRRERSEDCIVSVPVFPIKQGMSEVFLCILFCPWPVPKDTRTPTHIQ